MATGHSLRKRKVEIEGSGVNKKMRVGRRKSTGLVSLLNPTDKVAAM